MTARPVDPDRTDAVAQVIQDAIEGQPAHMTEHGPLRVFDLPRCYAFPMSERAANAILNTDDPAAVAALLATLAERHPDQYLTAGRDAGVLTDVGTSEDAQYLSGLHPRGVEPE